MGSPDPTDRDKGDELEKLLTYTAAEPGVESDEDDDEEDYEPSFFENPKRLAQSALIVLVLVVGIYVLLPKSGCRPGRDAPSSATRSPVWVAVSFGFAVVMFGAYVALFRGVVGERVKLRWKDSYDITMAGLAATRLFSAGGAGGIVLTYWALRKAGMPRKETAARMVAFLVLLYAVYMVTLVINGILMSTGVFSGPAPPGMTIVPAAIAGGVILVFLLMSLVPGDLERRFSGASQEKLTGRIARRLATVPATAAVGTRGGAAVRPRAVARRARAARRGRVLGRSDRDPLGLVPGLRRLGAARGRRPGLLRRHVRQPDPASRRGRRGRRGDARRLRALRCPWNIFAAILLYRIMAFWLPIPPGVVAFLQLRKTVHEWEETRRPERRSLTDPVPGSAITS